MKLKLTKTIIKTLTLPPGKRDHIWWDEDLPGFGFRIRAGGKQTWVVQQRIGKKQTRPKIGVYPALSLDEARKAAKTVIARVHLGHDPQREKEAARAKAAVTFAAAVERYLEERARPRLKTRTLKEVERHLRKHLAPLAKISLNGVERGDVATALAKIKKENGPVAAVRARAAVSALYSWAIGEGLTDSNPVIGTNKATVEIARDRVLSNDELTLILNHAGTGDYGDIIRLLVLTGQRREEIAAMGWDEIDLEAATWCIGSGRTKNSRPHNVPLSKPAIRILQARERRQGRDLVFGRGGPFSGWSKAKVALDRRLAEANGAPLAPWTLHDIRRTVATRLADYGVLPHVIEAILNHVSGHKAGVAGIYNRSSYAVEKREALRIWSEFVLKLLEGQ